jgi:hypothetical protein
MNWSRRHDLPTPEMMDRITCVSNNDEFEHVREGHF